MQTLEAFRNFRVIVVDHDPASCDNLTEMLRGWGLQVVAFTAFDPAVQSLERERADIIFFDILLLDPRGLEHLCRFGDDLKIIVLTGAADKTVAVGALELGAFDLQDKPFHTELLYYSVVRALKAIETERETKRLIDDLKRSRQDLLGQQKRLENLNARLFETNRALSIFSQNIEREREDIEKRIAMKLRNLIIPMVLKLKNDSNLTGYWLQLDMLAKQIENLSSGFAIDSRIATALSFAELQIASLIKNGITTQEIARQLHIAQSTVRTHRKNIRRKLKINNAQFSLRTYLNAKS